MTTTPTLARTIQDNAGKWADSFIRRAAPLLVPFHELQERQGKSADDNHNHKRS